MQISKPARKAVCCRCKSTTPGIFHQVKKQQHARCRCEQTEPETYHTVMHNFLQVPFSALTLGRVTGWASGLQKKPGVGLLVVTIWLELCTSYSASCHHHLHHPASIKSRMETFW